jgi:hypothetical protein
MKLNYINLLQIKSELEFIWAREEFSKPASKFNDRLQQKLELRKQYCLNWLENYKTKGEEREI